MGTKNDENEKVSKRRNFLGAFSAFFFGIFAFLDEKKGPLATAKKGKSSLIDPTLEDEVDKNGCKKN